MVHLDEEQLLRFTLGSHENPSHVQAHLDVCSECRTRQTVLAAGVFEKTAARSTPRAPLSPSQLMRGAPTQADRPRAMAAATTDSLRRGTTMGRYVLLEQLGTGGMGEVFAAFDPQLDRKVALKLLRGGATGAVEGRARLLREAQAMARLQHPNVAAVHDVGTFADRVFIAMDFIDGETLTDWLRGQPTWRETIEVFLQAGSGLAAAHQAGLIHRDFKPDNVLIGRDGRPRVLDFGLARQSSSVWPAVAPVGAPQGSSEDEKSVVPAPVNRVEAVNAGEAQTQGDEINAIRSRVTRDDWVASPKVGGREEATPSPSGAATPSQGGSARGDLARGNSARDDRAGGDPAPGYAARPNSAHSASVSSDRAHKALTQGDTTDGVPAHSESTDRGSERSEQSVSAHVVSAPGGSTTLGSSRRDSPAPSKSGATNLESAREAAELSRGHGQNTSARPDDDGRYSNTSENPDVTIDHSPGARSTPASASMVTDSVDTLKRDSDARFSHLSLNEAHSPTLVRTPSSPNETVPFSSSDSDLAALSTKLTLDGAVMGTPGYMAPEQLAGLATDERCDQFAFCAALYEALYGTRPFGGATLAQHAEEIRLAHFAPRPDNTQVPGEVLEVLTRGLAANPAERFTSMNALLKALRPKPRRRWRSMAAIIALGVLATLGVGFAAWFSQRLSVCGGSERRLAGVWDTPTKQKLRAAFERTDSGLAVETWKTTAKTLDAWSATWVNGSREACEASRIRKVDSPDTYERKIICLDGQLQRLRALTHLFEDADRDVVAHAAGAAASLDPVSVCFDLEALTRQPVLDEPARLAEANLQNALAEARALYDAGKYARGATLLRRAVTAQSSARAQAEGFLWLGRLLAKSGELQEAHAATVQAAEQAVRAGDAQLEAFAFSRLYGAALPDADEESTAVREASQASWSRLAHAAASRVPQDWEVQYELALNDALVSLRLNRLQEAMTQFERALSLVEEHRGPSHPDVATMHDFLGSAFAAAGDEGAAIEQFDRSFTLHAALEGTEHPNTAQAEANLATALRNVGRLREATSHDEHALLVRRTSLGDAHPDTLKSTENLSRAYLAADRKEEALGLLQRAVTVRTQQFGVESREVAVTLELIVEVLKASGFWREAHDTAQRELAIMRKVVGSESLSSAMALMTLGEIDTRLGSWAEARAHLLEALRIRRTKLGESSVEVAAALGALGDLALAMSSPNEAFDAYNRALAIHQKAGSGPGTRADLVGLGRAALLLNQPAVAAQALERALLLHEAGETPAAVAATKLELGRALWLTGPDAQPRAKTLLLESLMSMSETARGDALAGLKRRGITVELPLVDAG